MSYQFFLLVIFSLQPLSMVSGKDEAASDGAKAPVKNPAKAVAASPLPITKGLILDLDADKGVHLEEGLSLIHI